MPAPQQSDSLKKLVSENLKQIDQLLKAQRLEEAHERVKDVRRMDPTNAYARAFEERILEMKALALRRSLEQAEKAAAAQRAVPPPPPVDVPEEDKELEAIAQAYREEIAAEEAAEKTAQEEAEEPTVPSPSEVRPAQSLTAATPPPIRGSRTITTPPKRKASSLGFVVIIDDNIELLEEFSAMLEECEYAVAAYARTDDAYEFMKENYADLIICDVHLETSSFGGFTFYERIRELEHLRDVPFLFLSGMTDSRLVLAGKELGADDYLTKPIDPEELLAVVRGKLRRYRQIRKK